MTQKTINEGDEMKSKCLLAIIIVFLVLTSCRNRTIEMKNSQDVLGDSSLIPTDCSETTENNEVILPISKQLYPAFSDELSLWGCIDGVGNWVVSPRFADVLLLNNYEPTDDMSKLVVYENGGWGYLSSDGEVLLEPQFSYVTPFRNGVAKVKRKNENQFILIDEQGTKVSDCISLYDRSQNGIALHFDHDSEGFGNYGYIDEGCNLLILNGYTMNWEDRYSVEKYYFNNNLALTYYPNQESGSTGKYGYINALGEQAIQASFNFALPFSENIAGVGIGDSRANMKWGFIDPEGKYIIEPIYSNTIGFSDGLAAVCSGDKWGFINIEGETVIEPIYSDPFPLYKKILAFHNGMAIAGLSSDDNTNYGIIDKEGNWVIKPVYDEISLFIHDLAYYERQESGIKHCGYLDKSGVVIIEWEES